MDYRRTSKCVRFTLTLAVAMRDPAQIGVDGFDELIEGARAPGFPLADKARYLRRTLRHTEALKRF